MPKVRVENLPVDEELNEIIDDGILNSETVENGFEKFKRIKRTKMKDETNQYKNKKINKGRNKQHPI